MINKKTILKTFLTAILILVAFGTVRANAQITDKNSIPDGYTPIYTIEDLYAINNNLNGNYILMADIDMSETAPGGDWDFGYGWRPIGYFNNYDSDYFDGVLDGNGHRIYNLNIYGEVPYYNVGLIAEHDGLIKNLGIENVIIDIKGENIWCCGGLVGDGYSEEYCGKIDNCYITGEISVEGTDKRQFIGGLAGCARTICNCYSAVNLNSKNGSCLADYIEYAYNCYSIGSACGENTHILCQGYEEFEDIRSFFYPKDNCSSKVGTGLTKTQMKLQQCYTGFNFNDVWFIDKNSSYPYPQLRNCPQVRIESIKIKSKPQKLEYSLKEDLDLKGAVLTINYEDDYSVDVPIEESMCSYKMAKGVQTVTVNYCGQETGFDIEVGTEPEALIIVEQTQEIGVGESFEFKAEYNGEEDITFKSSNSKILSINKKTGVAKGIKAGTATITIKAGDLVEEIDVEVKKASPDKEKESDSEEDIEEELEPDFEMEVGESFKLAIKKVKRKILKSSDNSIVTINKKGKVTAKAPGTATIVVKDSVTKAIVDTYVILVSGDEEPDFEIEVGETVRVPLKKGYSLKVSDEKIVSVSKKGSILGLKPGMVTIIVLDKQGKEVNRYVIKVIK